MTLRVALLHSRIRVEEKLLLEELQRQGAEVAPVDVRSARWSLDRPEPWREFDVVFDRCLSHSQSLTVATILDSWSIPCINRAEVNRICGDKIEMSAVLARHGVPAVPSHVAVSAETALELMES
ncbi:MAG: ATP-grasp domain-containing protein, partial [Pirellulaceae bacterium]